MGEKKVRFTIDQVTLEGDMNSTELAQHVLKSLPINSNIQTWGDELYFSIPSCGETTDISVETVNKGDIAYWPPGNSGCLFWGPTPISEEGEIRSASPVTVIGKVEGDPTILSNVKNGKSITVDLIREY
tara:strand:- start:1653 stop:2039 length:387 start_codon:yes stop_codon:yes gene_type:complete